MMHRSVAGRRLAAAAVAVSVGGALAACSGSTGSSPAPSATVDAKKLVSSQPPAKGQVDKITWNVNGEPDTLDPRNAVNYGNGQIVRNLCESLMKMDADFNITPNLATPKVVSPTEIQFTVRDGVKFWDGSPLTAEDVAYSLQRNAAEDSVVSFAFINVKKIAVTGANEVTLTLSEPDAALVENLSTISGAVVEKDWAEKTKDKVGTPSGGLMCSGPYKFVSWRSGSGITIERNDQYWNPDIKPFAKQVDFTFISDSTALAQALESGEIDGSYEVPVSTFSKLSASKTGTLVFGPSTQSTNISVARPDGPMADQKLRDAFQRAIDREAVAKVVYQGAAEPNYTHLTPPTWPNAERDIYQPDYDAWAKARSYDLEAAKKLVSESSYDGTEVVLAIAAGDEASLQIAQLVQQQAKLIGVKIKIQSMEPLVFDQASYDASARKGVDLIYGANFNSRQNPLEPLGFDLLPEQPYNYTEFNNPEVTKLLTEALTTYDAKKRAELVVQAQKIYEPLSGTISLVATNEVTFINKRLTGAITSFAYWSMPQMAYIGAP